MRTPTEICIDHMRLIGMGEPEIVIAIKTDPDGHVERMEHFFKQVQDEAIEEYKKSHDTGSQILERYQR